MTAAAPAASARRATSTAVSCSSSGPLRILMVVGIETAGVPGMPDINFAIHVERFSRLKETFRQLKTASVPKNGGSQVKGEDEALRREKEMAEAGDPGAQVKLGRRYEEGRGVGKMCSEALILYRKAAGAGFAEGQYHVGRLFFEGKCVSRDFAEAARWFQKAAAKGLADAQMAFGALCFNGQGVSRDRVLGCMWTLLAVAGGSEEARAASRLMRAELKPDELKAAQEKAAAWKPAR